MDGPEQLAGIPGAAEDLRSPTEARIPNPFFKFEKFLEEDRSALDWDD